MSPLLHRVGLLQTLFRSGHKRGVRGVAVAAEGQAPVQGPDGTTAGCAFTTVVPAQAGVRMECLRAIGSHPAERLRAAREGRRSKTHGRSFQITTSMDPGLRRDDGKRCCQKRSAVANICGRPPRARVRMECLRAIGSHPAERPSAAREGRRSKTHGRSFRSQRPWIPAFAGMTETRKMRSRTICGRGRSLVADGLRPRTVCGRGWSAAANDLPSCRCRCRCRCRYEHQEAIALRNCPRTAVRSSSMP
jgi:hypothetical protein